MSTHVPDAELKVPEMIAGIYEHYKGNRYKVISVALHTETKEPLVVCQPLYDSPAPFWVRPYDMFVETVRVDGKEIPRFRYVGTVET